MNTLTDTQRRALEVFDVLVQRTANHVMAHYPDATPSKWVFETELTRMRVRIPTIRALERLGYLERRESGGFGWEYRRV